VSAPTNSPAARPPGWAGRVVIIHCTDENGRSHAAARVTIDVNGVVRCDEPDLMEQWRRHGIVGRSSMGRLYPKDGQTFVDELPFAYSGSRVRAESLREGAS
jgi:hypothetical protein